MPGTLRPAPVAVALLSAVAVAGCGLGAGPGTADVNLRITRDFGGQSMVRRRVSQVAGAETVMRLLQRSQSVSTRYGGGFVQSIDGLAGDGNRHDWFFYVNGREAPLGAAGTAIHRGDRIWWDLHDWSLTDTIPAVVGSFPEPFLHGLGGRRPRTVVSCAPGAEGACATVLQHLRDAGVSATTTRTRLGSAELTVEVGPWPELRTAPLSASITAGPRSSGVYVRFDRTGRRLSLLRPGGEISATFTAQTGLIAATGAAGGDPVWVVTGTDSAGVRRAADGLTERRLADHFAVVLSPAGDRPAPAGSGF